jgi:hypothetical protein
MTATNIEETPLPLEPIVAIHDRAAYIGAMDLIREHGEDAVLAASAEADRSRDKGNILQFSFWRTVETAIQIIQMDEVIGEIH